MRLLTYLVVYLTLIACKVYSQDQKTIQALSNFYQELGSQYENLLIFDGAPPYYSFSYEKLKPFTKPSEEALLKKILKKGKQKNISIKELNSFVSNDKFISMEDFNKLKVEGRALTKEDEALKSLIDSLIRISTSASDSAIVSKSTRELDSLYKTAAYAEILKKVHSNSKWLFGIHPYYSYKRYRLFLVDIYQSITNSTMLVKILRL